MWQGDPVSESGDLFRADWFQPSDRKWTPEDARQGSIRYYGASDIAASESTGDWTIHIVFGVDQGGLIHIVALWRGQKTPAAWIKQWTRMIDYWRPGFWVFGAGLAYRMVEPALRTAMRESKVFVRLHTEAERGEKPERAQAFSSLMENSRIRWDMDSHWYPQAFAELTRFPAGTTDDVADTVSLIGLAHDKVSRGQGPAGAAARAVFHARARPGPGRLPARDLGRYHSRPQDSPSQTRAAPRAQSRELTWRN